jgi:hypothetical protein
MIHELAQKFTSCTESKLRDLGNADKTINRKYASLKSLFKYLSDIAEHEDLTSVVVNYTYFFAASSV